MGILIKIFSLGFLVFVWIESQSAPVIAGALLVSQASLRAGAAALALHTDGRAPSQVYNVLENGVICDGTPDGAGTDNSEALTALIAKAASNASESHRVEIYFPPSVGACLISTAIFPKSHMDLVAAPGTITLAPVMDAKPRSALLVELSETTDNLISGLTFDGGLRYGADRDHTRLLLIAGVTDLRIERCVFQHTAGIAIEHGGASGSRRVAIADNKFIDIGNLWRMSGKPDDRAAAINFDIASELEGYSEDITVSGNTLTDIGLDPIDVATSRRVTIQANVISLENGPAQWAHHFPDYPDSISGGGTDYSVLGNIIHGSPGMCIAIGADNLTIAGNICASPGAAGISTRGSNVTISGNTISNPVQETSPTQNAGITLFGLTANASVSGNVIADMHVQYGNVIVGRKEIDNLLETEMFRVGDPIVASAFPAGTTVSAVNGPTRIIASNVAIATNKQERLLIGAPRMPYCYQGIGHLQQVATGDLVNIYIDRNNVCAGPGVAVFAPYGGINLRLDYGMNFLDRSER